MNDRPLIIYHANCQDGFGSALAAWKRFGDEADYIPAQYGQEPPDTDNQQWYILDFSYPFDVMCKLARRHTVTILDHHKTAQSDIEKLIDRCIIFGEFDTERSGAMLAWQYFHPGKPIPALIQYIQDRDLWKFNIVATRAVSAALMTLPHDFETWDYYLDSDNLHTLIEKGRAICDYQQALIDKIAASDDIAMQNIAGHIVPVVNATHLISEIGNCLAPCYPFVALYFETADKRVYSLRSAAGGVDVSDIAKRFGGGGHRHAAGFSVDKPLIDLSGR